MGLWLVLANQVGLVGTLVLVVCFTPANSLVRPLLLPGITALVSYGLILNKEAIANAGAWSLVNLNTAGLFLQYLDVGLISRWTYSAYGPTSSRGGQPNASLDLAGRKKPPSSSLLSRLQWGFSTATSWRAPSTVWEAKGTPHFEELPSRGRFLARNAMTLLWSVLVLDVMGLVGGDLDPVANAAHFTWDRVRFLARLGDVSRDEVILRATVVYMRWGAMYFSLQVVYSFLAIVFVMVGLSPVQRWPPLFGSFTEIYTLRNTWGKAWHQLIRQKVSSPAHYTTYSLLGLRKGGIAGRYTCILATFFVSGLLHLFCAEYSYGIQWDQSGTLRFYSIQALGIAMEDAVQATSRRLFAYRSTYWTRAIGYVWVLLWFLWTSPAYFFPLLKYDTEKRPPVLLGPIETWLQSRHVQ
uniref:Acetyltransferase aurG n=1 Tax=Calcarisporium arbuscula TaxID=240499 RepID=AURG_CALAK|nr:RecName: Full=Acetyltransferase aurG; AltName: Full=Aurovertin biosynthesis cluster protein G [Calcarisporium arbuscula]ALD83633.1 O-acyl-transferase [Calcarisporium arbuscula]